MKRNWLFLILLGMPLCLLYSQSDRITQISLPAREKGEMEFIAHPLETDFLDVGSIRSADLDSDGDMDLVGASNRPGSIVWWENLDVGSGSFFRKTVDESFNEAYDVVIADFDGDSDPDILGGTYFGYEVAWWENVEEDSFPKTIIDADLRWTQSVFAIDVDGDGDMDAVAGSKGENDIVWFENDGNGTFVKNTIETSFMSVSSIFAIDMENDGDVDVIGIRSSQVAWWENDGNEGFTKHDIGGGFSFGCFTIAADLDGDGDNDVVTADKYGNEISWWGNDGAQNFTKDSIDADIGWVNWLHTADLDNDSDLDLLAASHTDGYICMYENLGSKNFQKRIIHEDMYGASFVNSADLDNDGDLDIIGASSGKNDIFWWENTLLTSPDPVDPEIELEPDTILLLVGPDDPDTISYVLTIKNKGNGTLNIKDISYEAEWLTNIDTTAFLVKPGAEQNVVIRCNVKGMLNGLFETALTIRSNDPLHPDLELLVRLEMKGGQDVHFVNEIEPNNAENEAQVLFGPSPAGVKGTISVSDVGDITIQGDDIEDLFTFTLESSYLKIYLYNTEADLDVILMAIDGSSITIWGSNHRGAVMDETFEIEDLNPGTYHVGVSIYDDRPLQDNSTYDLALVGDIYKEVDETAPVITISAPVEGYEYETGSIPLEWTMEETDFKEGWYSLDHGVTTTTIDKTGVTTIELDNGEYIITFYGEDHTGNRAMDSVAFSVNVPTHAEFRQANDDHVYQVYPNPVVDQLNVSSLGGWPFSIEIVSTTGHEIYCAPVIHNASVIDLSFLKKGIYFITISSSNYISTQKIIKL